MTKPKPSREALLRYVEYTRDIATGYHADRANGAKNPGRGL